MSFISLPTQKLYKKPEKKARKISLQATWVNFIEISIHF